MGFEPYRKCMAMCSPDPCVCKEGYIRISEQDRTCVAEDECADYYATIGAPNPGKM